MQGTVWGSLKCTTQMDEMNKIMTKDKSLQYKYKNDAEISIGVLGMVDDTLAITECGNEAIKKNAVINSFIETRRLELHEDKSVVIKKSYMFLLANKKECFSKEGHKDLPSPI